MTEIDYGTAVGPEFAGERRLVPSARSGVSAPSHGELVDVPVEPEDEDRTSTWRASVRAMNPMTIEGPRMPLMVLGLSSALGGWSSAALGIAGPEIQATFGTSVSGMVLLMSITGGVSMVLGLPLGYLADRVNRVWLTRIGALTAAIGPFFQAISPNMGAFTAAGTAAELANMPADTASLPLLSDYYPTRSRARVFGFLSIAGQIGGMISGPLIAWLVVSLGWRQATLSLSGMSLLIALLTFLLREPKRGIIELEEAGLVDDETVENPPPPSISEALRGAWSIRSLRLQAIAGFVGGFAAPLTFLTGLLLASKFAMGPTERAWLGVLVGILTLPTVLIGTAMADVLLAKKPSTVVVLQAVAMSISSAAMVGVAFAPNLVWFVALSTLPIMVQAAIEPVSSAIMAMVVPPRYRGVGLQVFSVFSVVALLMAPALMSIAGTISLQAAFVFFAPFLVLSSLIYLASAGSVAADIRAARASAAAELVTIKARREKTDELLVVRDLEVAFGELIVLASIDFDVRSGQIVALSGTNGSGKSTLLKALCGLQPATNGAVFFDEAEITHIPAHLLVRRGVVYVPGGEGVFPSLTVRENLAAARARYLPADSDSGEAPAEFAATDVADVLRLFPALADRLDTPAGKLSGGEQQMVALAQAFLLQPRLLLIDEMSIGLAPAVVDQLVAAVRTLNAEGRGTTVVLVEQSLNLAMRICDELVYLDEGRVVYRGTPAGLLDHPELVRARFLGNAARRTRGKVRGAEAADSTVLSCEELQLSFGGVVALDNTSLSVRAGEIVGLIGANGAGKTTLFDVLSGFQRPDHGTVELLGDDVTHASPDERARRGLSRAFQRARLFGQLSVAETIRIPVERRAVDVNRQVIDARVHSLLTTFGLQRYADSPISVLSTGSRRAVELACLSAWGPSMLLLDEPASGLAQAEVEQLGPSLTRLVRETGTGVLIVEHDLPLLQSICDRLIALERGRVIADGTPSDVLADPAVIALYLNASAESIQRSGAATPATSHSPNQSPQQEGPRP